mgnify:CR=1 FL=1
MSWGKIERRKGYLYYVDGLGILIEPSMKWKPKKSRKKKER